MMENECKKHNVTWDRVFVSLGILATLIAFGQSILQIVGLRISSKYLVIPYIWFFCIGTWATIIYGGYTIRLLYLVRCERCEDLSRFWWYIAVVVMLVNPAQSVWWWLSEDYLLLYVSVPASVVYVAFFVLVCRSMADGKASNKNARSEEAIAEPVVGRRETIRLVTSV